MPSLLRSLSAARLLASRRVLVGVRSWLARTFDVPHEARVSIVVRMLEGHARGTSSYWLQLCIALALATLGLVLNGPAVVIGAMLVSPLMGPIVELGMGLAVGSAVLSIRSVVRSFWSIIVVVIGAALITAGLPFHEITGEIAARASPTALDLLVAIFCAMAAVFTTLRSGTGGASAAAGTAIAIALVPPLCVVGFGLGTADRQIAQGAFLLFTANLCAILVVAALSFWLFGFNLVDARHLEQRQLQEAESVSRSLRLVKHAFGSRFGTWARLIIPLALVATVWFPLTRALREVSWEVRTRTQVQKIIGELPLARNAVRSSVSLKHRNVHIGMVVIGKPSEARSLQATLATRIADTTRIAPTVEVVAVPDLETMEDVARTLARSELAERKPQVDLLGATGSVAEALKEFWPRAAAGEIRRWRLDLTNRERPALEIVHIGQPLGESGQTLLGSVLSERLHAPLEVREVAIPSDVASADASQGAVWLPKLSAAIDWVRADHGLIACVTLPPPDDRTARRRGSQAERERRALLPVRSAALAELATAPQEQVHWSPAARWSVQVRAESCESAPSSP
jgi:uncharacterized hydrophobic protein (TIGR00271 family)